MKILHTSDWHLGRTLYAKKERVLEHKAFLDWLVDTIELHGVDVLLIAGDVFDTASPSSISQKLYYDFLVKVKSTCCRNIIIVGGNHDSPSFLNAPKHILASLNISIVGCATENIADELILIKNKENEPELIICGVPFLRERDISRFAEGESYSDRSKRINENIKKHYTEIGQLAVAKRAELGINIPIIATGHLSVMGGKRNEDDGVREAYIGNIEAIGSDIFHAQFDYVALGHYHIASCIQDHIRYCGSPIPMGFGEATQTKCVYLIDFTMLNQLKESNESVWVEINYKSDLLFPNLSVWIAEQTKDSLIEVLKLQNKRGLTELLFAHEDADSLDELNEFEVFEKLLHKEAFSDEQIDLLKETYQEIVSELKIGE